MAGIGGLGGPQGVSPESSSRGEPTRERNFQAELKSTNTIVNKELSANAIGRQLPVKNQFSFEAFTKAVLQGLGSVQF